MRITDEIKRLVNQACEGIDAKEDALAETDVALKSDYAKRLADSTADLRRNAQQSALQLADANKQVKDLQEKCGFLLSALNDANAKLDHALATLKKRSGQVAELEGKLAAKIQDLAMSA